MNLGALTATKSPTAAQPTLKPYSAMCGYFGEVSGKPEAEHRLARISGSTMRNDLAEREEPINRTFLEQFSVPPPQ